MQRNISLIRVHPSACGKTIGRLSVGSVSFACVLGRSGIVVAKREGDGGTPRGALPLRGLLQRPGRGVRIASRLPWRAIRPVDAWCDDPADPRYNTLVSRAPDEIAEERLARADHLYDVIVPLGWNDGPIIRGRGSAIFWHVARGKGAPTAGCVAVAPDVFRKVLPRLSRHTVMIIG